MDDYPLLDDVKPSEPNHRGPNLNEKMPPQYGGATGGVKRWDYNDKRFTYANGKPLATLSNQIVLLIQLDSGATTLNYSAVATSQGWRADMFLTAFLKIGGASVAQYPLPVVQCFCGSQNVFVKTGIESAYFGMIDSVDLNYSVPHWARCA